MVLQNVPNILMHLYIFSKLFQFLSEYMKIMERVCRWLWL